MKYENYRDGFFLPNELFQLGLDYGELAVYSFLKRCEGAKIEKRISAGSASKRLDKRSA